MDQIMDWLLRHDKAFVLSASLLSALLTFALLFWLFPPPERAELGPTYQDPVEETTFFTKVAAGPKTLKGGGEMKKIIGGKLYDTETAPEVASNRYWDGSNWERHGRNTYLYRTKKGNFFLHYTTQWQGERDSLDAISEEEAKEWFEKLPEPGMSYVEAFGVEPEEA